MTERRPFADAALTYYRGGWPNPLPVEGKILLVRGYTGYDGANVEWPRLNQWLSDHASANLAVRMPGDVVGIDVDAYDGKTGAASMEAAQAQLGELPPTYRSTSRPPFGESGIYFYRVPAGRSMRGAEKRFVEAFGPHVDVIRRDHRYAVVWPSVHPDTGQTYLWYSPDGETMAAPPRPADLAELPATWVDFLADPAGAVTLTVDFRPAQPDANPSPWDLPRQFTEAAAVEFVRPAFERLRSAVDGTINNRLNEAAVMVGHFVPAFWPREQAQAWLLDALTSTVYDGRTWKAEDTIRSGLGARTWRAERLAERAADEAEKSDPDEVTDRFPVLDWRALWADDNAEEWIISPILPARRLVALYSPPKVGKSLLALELAVGVARGTSVLGYRPDRGRRVLYVDFENDPKGDIRPRLEDMGYGPDDLTDLRYLSFPPLGPLDTAAGAAELVAIVEAQRVEVVIIDTVSRAVRGEENENDTWLAFYRHTGKALKARGVAMMRLDHTGKDESKGQRGASAKSGDVDMVWRMSRVTDVVYRLECEAHRMPVLEPSLTIHRETSPKLWHRAETGGYGAYRAAVAVALEAMDRLDIPRDAGRPTVAKLLREAGVLGSNSLISEAIRVRRMSDSPVLGSVSSQDHIELSADSGDSEASDDA